MITGLIIGAWISVPIAYGINKNIGPALGFAFGVTFACLYIGYNQ